MADQSDIELMFSLKRGDRRALSVLFERYERPLVHFLAQMLGNEAEAADLFQETFLRVLRAAKTWEPKAAFSTWVYTIARNLALDRLKKVHGLPTVALEGDEEDEGSLRETLPAATADPGDSAGIRELATVVRGALRQLPPKKREVLFLRVYQGLPYEEIARIVNAPLGTVKYRIHDALKSLAVIVNAAVAPGPQGV